jgi:hypothetical protein
MVCTLRSSGYSCVHLYSRNSLTGKVCTDAIILELFEGHASKFSFKNVDILPSTLKEGYTTVVCDPKAFNDEDLDTLGFKCQVGTFELET